MQTALATIGQCSGQMIGATLAPAVGFRLTSDIIAISSFAFATIYILLLLNCSSSKQEMFTKTSLSGKSDASSEYRFEEGDEAHAPLLSSDLEAETNDTVKNHSPAR